MSTDFYSKRRSVLAKKMSNKEIPKDDLKKILAAGIRVPDHGALNPWKIKVITGKKLKFIDEEIILKEFKKQNPNSTPVQLELESNRFQRAGAILAVISTPVEHPKIPEWEMLLSSGAVCMNLLSCAQSLGYAGQWLTEWYAYNHRMLEFLGGNIDRDRISGFIYLGHKTEEPNERRRPDPEKIISYV